MMHIKRNLLSLAKHPLLLACILYLLFNTSLIGGSAAVGGDGLLLFYPAVHFLRRSLLAGNLPFWTPYVQAGFPLLADGQPGALYPPNLILFGLFNTSLAYDLVVVLHGLLGLLFTYWFARHLRLSRVAAAGAGLLFAITSPLSGGNLPHLETLTWMPLLFLAAAWFAETEVRPMRLVAAPLSVAMQWTAGFPQIAFYSLIGASVYLLGQLLWARRSWRCLLVRGGYWVAGTLLGVLLAAPQLLPTWQLASFSIRSSGIGGSMAGEGSLFPGALITLLLPGLRAFLVESGLGSGIYAGVLTLLLAASAILAPALRRRHWPLLLCALVALFFALGRYNPVFPLLRVTPGFSSFRVPSRFLVVTQFCLILLAGMGWDRLAKGNGLIRRWLFRLVSLSLLLYLAVGLIAHPLVRTGEEPLLRMAEQYAAGTVGNDPYHLQSDDYVSQKVRQLYGQLLQAINPATPDFVVPFMALLVVWIAGRSGGLERTRLASGLLIAVILFDVAHAEGWARPAIPTDVLTDVPATVTVLREQAPDEELCRLYWMVDEEAVTFDRTNLALLPANYNAVFGLSAVGLYSPLGFADYYELMGELSNVNLAFGLRTVAEETLVERRGLLDYLNVCYVLARAPLQGFAEMAQVDGVWIYHNEQALPRAFLAAGATPGKSGNVVDVWRARSGPATELVAAGGRVDVVTYEPQVVEIAVQSDRRRLLVLTDSYYPGWRVFVDGEQQSLLRVDGLFRGVWVSSGAHLVTFEYVPDAFNRGIIIALLGVSALLVYLGWSRRRSRVS